VITKTGEYALRVVLYIARAGEEGPVRAMDAATDLRLPGNYLSKILHTLARSGVLDSERGRHGGFVLARPAHRITLAEVLEPFEQMSERRECLLGRPVCSDRAPCAAHAQWKAVSDTVHDFFGRTTVADLAGEPASGPVRSRKGASHVGVR
jgi:Rrf2 family protein